jgi:hypothetical protein
MRLISHALFSGQFLIALMDTSVGGWVGGWVLGVWVGGRGGVLRNDDYYYFLIFTYIT